MAALKLFNLFALSSIAILAVSFGSSPVAALSVSTNHAARHPAHPHGVAAKKRRDTKTSKRCKPRSTALSATLVQPPKITSHVAPPAQTSKSSNSGNSNSGSNGSNGSNSGAGNTAPPSNGGSGNTNVGGGKAAVAYVGDASNLVKYKTAKSRFTMNWSPFKPSNTGGLEYVPTLWGPKQTSDFKRLVVNGYAKYALGFNEPNEPSQSNMSPQSAAQLWKEVMEPLKDQGYTLISPACTNAPSGKVWMQQFLAACDTCTIDAIGVHFYGPKAADLISFLTDYHNTFGKNIWLTEFACQDFSSGTACSRDQVFSFMDQTTGFMDTSSFVDVYAWFGFMADIGNVNPLNQLVNPANGNLNDLGQDYLN